jgi:predicted lysophospholipase L1 biosynthesis ABC-type transport system permease subunit
MTDPKNDIAEIKAIMERSTRFLSLSGLSGVLAGVFALIGAALAYYWVYYPNSPLGYRNLYVNEPQLLIRLGATAVMVLMASVITGFLLTRNKTKKSSEVFWNKTSRRFLGSLFVPVFIGGLFIFALLIRGYFVIVAPASLIFYGLALLNASHFTLGDIRYLAYSEIFLGLVAAFVPGYGLIFWTLGFGFLHIAYGFAMHIKYGQ